MQAPVHLVVFLGLRLKRREYPLPYPRRAPAVEPARHRPDRAVALGQVAPRRTGAQNPQNAVQNGAVVVVRPARARPLGRQQWLQAPPLRVRQIIASHPSYMGAIGAAIQTCTPLQTRRSTTAGIAVINWAAMEAWSCPQWMKLSIGRVSWMRWLSRSRRVFAGLSRVGGYGPICRACLLLWSARTAGNWPRAPGIDAGRGTGFSCAHALGCRSSAR